MGRLSLYYWNQFGEGLGRQEEGCSLGESEVYQSQAGWEKHSIYNELKGIQ